MIFNNKRIAQLCITHKYCSSSSWTISFFFTVETFDSFCINYCRTMEYNYDSNNSNFCSSKLKRASWSESDLRWLFLFLNGIINPWIFWSYTKCEAKLLEVYRLLSYLWGWPPKPPSLLASPSSLVYIDDWVIVLKENKRNLYHS